MKPPAFDYARPTTVDEAVALLADSSGEAKLLAGGQSLVPLMNFRLAAPDLLIDLNHVEGLASLEAGNGQLRIGSMTRTRVLELDPLVRESIPVLAAAATWIGHVQIRNRGTVGGSIAHADPAAELPALCLLLDATLVAVSSRGSRVIPAADAFVGFLTTDLLEDEVLTEIRFPMPAPGTAWGFGEYAQRRGDFALSGAAALLAGRDGKDGGTRIVVFGGAERPLRATSAEGVLRGQAATTDLIAQAARVAADETTADDSRPDASYRRVLTETLVRRALEDASARAAGRDPRSSEVN
jgi:CO/xanthine dehydrogenase FAD-binding subunit